MWNVETMLFGRWTVDSTHNTEQEAREAYEAIMAKCAPWVRNAVRVTHTNA